MLEAMDTSSRDAEPSRDSRAEPRADVRPVTDEASGGGAVPPSSSPNRWFAALVVVCGVFVLTTLLYLVAVFQDQKPVWVVWLVEHFLTVVAVLVLAALVLAGLGLRQDQREAWAMYEARLREWHQRLAARRSLPSAAVDRTVARAAAGTHPTRAPDASAGASESPDAREGTSDSAGDGGREQSAKEP
ncbi:MAG: hypothetical protein D6725_17680 [Planctomycetota bacterium]|nr:MAG: hypothetical protein D6725_17680 [Planctomycetota bacterium]